MKIFYSPEFQREYKRLSADVKERAKQKEKIFCEYPFDKRLKTHKLSGKFNEYWAFSIDFKYRIIFKFYNEKIVRFYAIGGHSIYR